MHSCAVLDTMDTCSAMVPSYQYPSVWGNISLQRQSFPHAHAMKSSRTDRRGHVFSSAAASKATGHSKGRGDCVDGADLGSMRAAKLWTPTLLHSLRQSRLIPEIELLPAWPHVTGGLQRSTFLQGLCASPNAIDPFVSWTHLAIWQGWIRNFWVQRPQTHSKGWENMGKRSHVLSLHSQ